MSEERRRNRSRVEFEVDDVVIDAENVIINAENIIIKEDDDHHEHDRRCNRKKNRNRDFWF